ncbi:MAG: tripartite tricarboxylate transporter TctB family protein [Smithellaceae bacterium]
MDIRNLISSMLIFFFAACVVIVSLGLGIGSVRNPQAGFMPFWISVGLVFFSLLLFAFAYRDKAVSVRWADLWHRLNWQKNMVVVAALVVYVLVLEKLGYLIATFALMLILFFLCRVRFWAVLAGSLACVLLSYGLFHLLLKTPLPRGILGI